eukprot:TRINITY_DN60424_c0_g1_i1.p1 TRINITY_DN60424_c0_g1~~TRINITY_DN60424_c0_g1_i1.p1  ORF type:complete len:349 (+),score=61.44 TRINITY_DN60424_c0_g1_i1:80-1126(+)
MIYIFKAPCLACEACCKGFSKTCSCILEPLKEVLSRPLGGYVLMTGCLMIPTMLFALVAAVDKKVSGCKVAPAQGLCLADFVLAFIHIGFSIYIQTRIVNGLRKKAAAKGQDAAGRSSNSDMLDEIGAIVLYDIGFCLYTVVFIGAFFLNCIGYSWVADCDVGGMPTFVATLMVFYAWATGMAMCCSGVILCCGSCFDKGRSATGSKKKQQTSGYASRFVLGQPSVYYGPAYGYGQAQQQQQPLYGQGMPPMGQPVPGQPMPQGQPMPAQPPMGMDVSQAQVVQPPPQAVGAPGVVAPPAGPAASTPFERAPSGGQPQRPGGFMGGLKSGMQGMKDKMGMRGDRGETE